MPLQRKSGFELYNKHSVCNRYLAFAAGNDSLVGNVMLSNLFKRARLCDRWCASEPSKSERNNMNYYIYGTVEAQQVTVVGCSITREIPVDSIVLQVTDRHPELHRVKWSVRFRSTLKDKAALTHPYVKYFKNSARLTRLFEDKVLATFIAEQNTAFTKFSDQNPHVLTELLDAALAKKAEGRNEYSMDQLLGDLRWSDTEVNRGDDRFKVNANWSPWYSRVVQMIEPRLLGFFAVRPSIADELVWIDGRTWHEFVSEHEGEILDGSWTGLE